VRWDRAAKPGVSNLLEILAALTERAPDDVAAGYDRYGPLKADTAEAIIEFTRPIRQRYAELLGDPGAVTAVLRDGASKASAVAAPTLARANRAIGLLAPG
jgi:tryptophanyl-tRNA synthetase